MLRLHILIKPNSIAFEPLRKTLAHTARQSQCAALGPDPHRFDVERPNAGKHLAFSGGRHFCLGAALARAEGEVGLRRFFTHFPDVQLAGLGTRRDTRVLRGWAELPVSLGTARLIFSRD